MSAVKSQVYIEGEDTPFGPDRVVEHPWGLTLVFDGLETTVRRSFPWHRIVMWREQVQLPSSKDPV